jgi:hypothetical protein
MYAVYECGEWSVVRLGKTRKYILWRWLGQDEGWCEFGTYRSKRSAIREIDNMIPEGE